jgi:hypothetical protein
MTDKQPPAPPERISPTLCQKCGSMRLHEPNCQSCGAYLFFTDEIEYARVHPDDARVEAIRQRMIERRLALGRAGDDYCIGPSVLDDIDYLLSLFSSSERRCGECGHDGSKMRGRQCRETFPVLMVGGAENQIEYGCKCVFPAISADEGGQRHSGEK